jgi:hypothetical protein
MASGTNQSTSNKLMSSARISAAHLQSVRDEPKEAMRNGPVTINRCLWLALLLLAAPAFSSAGDVPYVAKRSITVRQVGPDGSILKEQVSEGLEMRSTDGSKRRETTRSGYYSLFVGPDNASYTVIPSQRQARKHFQIPAEAITRTSAEVRLSRRSKALGTKVISGLSCDVFPVLSNQQNAQHRICHALEQDILLEEESIHSHPDGSKTSRTDVVTDLKIGVEPERSALTLPPDYQVVSGLPGELQQ